MVRHHLFFAFIQQVRKLKAAICSGQCILFICYRWIVSNKKSLEIANIFLSILAMPSSEFLNNPFLSWIFCQFPTVSNIIITVLTFVFHIFLSFRTRSCYFVNFFLSYSCTVPTRIWQTSSWQSKGSGCLIFVSYGNLKFT